MRHQAGAATEAGQQVDAKAFQRPKAAVKGTIRRRLKRVQARSDNITRPVRPRGMSLKSAMSDTVPNGNAKDHLEARRNELWLALFMHDGSFIRKDRDAVPSTLVAALLLHHLFCISISFHTLYPSSDIGTSCICVADNLLSCYRSIIIWHGIMV